MWWCHTILSNWREGVCYQITLFKVTVLGPNYPSNSKCLYYLQSIHMRFRTIILKLLCFVCVPHQEHTDPSWVHHLECQSFWTVDTDQQRSRGPELPRVGQGLNQRLVKSFEYAVWDDRKLGDLLVHRHIKTTLCSPPPPSPLTHHFHFHRRRPSLSLSLSEFMMRWWRQEAWWSSGFKPKVERFHHHCTKTGRKW